MTRGLALIGAFCRITPAETYIELTIDNGGRLESSLKRNDTVSITGTLVGVEHTVDVNLVHEVTRSKPRALLGPGQTALEIITDLEPECAVTYLLNPEHEVQLTGTKTIR